MKISIIEAFGNPLEEPKYSLPPFYCCHITKKLMFDPVIVSSGFSYERNDFEKHLSENGWKDPITGNEIDKDLKFDNINLKQAIETFVQE